MMLQNQIPLRSANEACAKVSGKLKRRSTEVVLHTAVAESCAIAASKGVWTGGKLHASGASKGEHP